MKRSRAKKPHESTRIRPSKPAPQRRSKVYSYYASGSAAAEPDSVNNKPRTWRLPTLLKGLKLLPGAIALLVIVCSVLYSFTLSSKPTVSVLQNLSSPYRSIQEYADTVDEIMSSSTWGRTKFTMQTYEVEQALLDRYPELQDAALRLPVLGRKPQLVVEIRQPALLLADSSGTYVLDQNGIAVSDASAIPATDKQGLAIVHDKNNNGVKVGKQILTRETIQFIAEIAHQLSSKGYTIKNLALPASINELDISFNDLPYFTKTDTSGDARLQAGSFISTERYLVQQGTAPREYIDVRVEEKVFYK